MTQLEQPATTPTHDDVLSQRTHGWTVQQWIDVQPHVAYHVTRTIVSSWLRTCWRLRYYGADGVPTEGSTLATPNHSSYLDGWFQALGHRRLPRWMGKQEIIDAPVLGAYLRRGGVFPVKRGKSDAVAIDIGRLLLENGQHVVVYAEGTRIRHEDDDLLGTPRRGAARLALATGATILPIATYGLKPNTGRAHLHGWRKHLPLRRRVTTIYGDVFTIAREDAPSRERVDEVCTEMWARVTELYDLAREATLAAVRPDEITLPSGRVARSGRA